MITVCMLVFNGEKYLESAIKSILNQSFQDFELLILDDGSTDRSAQIVREIDSPKIRFLQNARNQGLALAKHRALQEANRKYFAILDCDDWAYPNRLKEQVNFLEQHPKVAAVGSWVEVIDGENNVKNTWNLPTKSEEIKVKMLFRNCFAHPSMMIRREIFNEFSYRNEYPPAEDYDLWSRILQKYEMANLPKILIKYRVHGNNISQTKKELLLENHYKIVGANLANLGILPNENDLQNHKKIADLDFLDWEIAKNWLLKLRIANQKTQIYSQKDFDKELSFYWKELFLQNSPNFSLFSDWIFSEFSYKNGFLMFFRITLGTLFKIIKTK
ncbi:MAG: glycosyltransferase [Bacteroidetes bacterium]|nr:MAG: glycosyltransferase [Bacteroidota bacterium]